MGWYSRGSVGLREDSSKAFHYLTLACNKTTEDPAVVFNLGMSYCNDNAGLAKSLTLAKHYLERAAKKECKKEYYPYAKA